MKKFLVRLVLVLTVLLAITGRHPLVQTWLVNTPQVQIRLVDPNTGLAERELVFQPLLAWAVGSRLACDLAYNAALDLGSQITGLARSFGGQ